MDGNMSNTTSGACFWSSGGIRIATMLSAGPMTLPSAAGAVAVGLPLACGGRLCGGSAEDAASGFPVSTARPSFVGITFDNAVTDFGAIGDGVFVSVGLGNGCDHR